LSKNGPSAPRQSSPLTGLDAIPVSGLDPHDKETALDDQFLINEGLELLAHYREVPDRAVRLAFKALLETLVAANRSSRPLYGFARREFPANERAALGRHRPVCFALIRL
jgi:hypothetical protein